MKIRLTHRASGLAHFRSYRFINPAKNKKKFGVTQ